MGGCAPLLRVYFLGLPDWASALISDYSRRTARAPIVGLLGPRLLAFIV